MSDWSNHPRCRTCVHFALAEDEWDVEGIGFGKCKLIPMTDQMSEWTTTEGPEAYTKLVLTAEHVEHLAGVMDGSSYRAELNPHPDFYCPMHSDLMPQLVEGDGQ
jgi:hypothetical protein